MSIHSTLENPALQEAVVYKQINPRKIVWSAKALFAFHIAFIFFALFSIPLDVGFYKMILHIDYAHLNYRHTNEVFAFYNPQFISHFSEGGFFGWQSYINLPFIFAVALIGALIWTALDKKNRNYELLYYWLRVLARYRVAYAGIGWGYKKLFIMQMPEQYEGLWNTPLVDFFVKRLYWEHLSVATKYEFFLGFAEFIGGFLLLFRKTTCIGAFITLAVFGNIAIANHAYDIGEQVPSACMAMLSLFIIWKDIPAIWQLLVKQKDAVSIHFYPTFSKWQNTIRHTIKYAFNFVFVVLFFAFELYGYTHNDFYKIPNTPGLKNAEGYYNVTEFRLNNKVIPYSPFDKKRWQDVTFEKWSSFSFKVSERPQQIEMFAAGSYPRNNEVYDNKWHFDWTGDPRRYPNGKRRLYDPTKRDLNIGWEASGMAGRIWYYYKADTARQVLYMQNKNRGDRDQKQELHYRRPDANRIILNGLNEFNDSIYVVLDKVKRNYPLHVKN